jgi:hypothetical protein
MSEINTGFKERRELCKKNNKLILGEKRCKYERVLF